MPSVPWAKKSPEPSRATRAVEEHEEEPEQKVDTDRAGDRLRVDLVLVDDAERDRRDRRHGEHPRGDACRSGHPVPVGDRDGDGEEDGARDEREQQLRVRMHQAGRPHRRAESGGLEQQQHARRPLRVARERREDEGRQDEQEHVQVAVRRAPARDARPDQAATLPGRRPRLSSLRCPFEQARHAGASSSTPPCVPLRARRRRAGPWGGSTRRRASLHRQRRACPEAGSPTGAR